MYDCITFFSMMVIQHIDAYYRMDREKLKIHVILVFVISKKNISKNETVLVRD